MCLYTFMCVQHVCDRVYICVCVFICVHMHLLGKYGYDSPLQNPAHAPGRRKISLLFGKWYLARVGLTRFLVNN